MEGSFWFKKFKKEVKKMSPHFQFRRIKYGFYRIYWTGGGEPAYVHEVYKWMPYKGYDWEEKDPRYEDKKYWQEKEDDEIVLKVKNFVEGYVDSMQTMRKRFWMFRNNAEFRKEATAAYRNVRIK